MAVELASNDGYLLQYFKRAGVQVLGVEPTANTAQVALKCGVPREVAFFRIKMVTRLRDRGVLADGMAANNVLARVPDINDFVSGYPIILKPDGVANIEFPHLLSQIENNQFDTIYTSISATYRSRSRARFSLPTGSAFTTWQIFRQTAVRSALRLP